MSSCAADRKTRPIILSLLICSTLLLSALAMGPGVCRASTVPAGNLVFILDASGSMGAKIQGKMKIDIAKEALSNLIKDLPAGVNVGLVAYGHRQKADCNDVEELSSLAPLDKKALIDMIMALDHKGKTPITFAVRQVAESLKAEENETTIVLVSDGEETCDGDPCALVKELRVSGIKFVMHVIGFDVTDKEKAQLACVAEAGGGSYLAAKNAGELAVAAKKVVQKAEESSGKLKIRALRNGKPVGAWYEVYKADAEGDSEKESISANPIGVEGETVKLAPGVYDLTVKNQEDVGDPTVSFAGIKIEAGKTIEKVADFSGGSLRVKALRNGKPVGAWYEIYKVDEHEDNEKEGIASNPIGEEGETVKLVPGVYHLTVRNQEDVGNPTISFSGIKIEAGKIIEKVADFSGGSLRVKALRNGKPVGARYEVYKAEAEEDGEKEHIASNPFGAEGETVKLAPGVYDLKVQDQEDLGNPTVSFAGIKIEAGKAVEKVAEFSGGALKIKALRNGKPIDAGYELFKAAQEEDSEKESVVSNPLGSEGETIKLPPGVYDLTIKNFGDAGKTDVDFPGVKIEAGKVVEKVAEF
jgi:Ca-activated chloride channel homolog